MRAEEGRGAEVGFCGGVGVGKGGVEDGFAFFDAYLGLGGFAGVFFALGGGTFILTRIHALHALKRVP